MAGDDEQGVVDADTEADEGAEHGGEVGDRHRVPEQGDAEIGGAHADQGGREGQQARGEGAEGEEEDQARDGHADDLGEVGGGCLGQGDGPAAQFDLEAVRLGGRVLRGVDHGLGLRLGYGVGRPVEGHLGIRGAAVGADPGGALGPGAVRAGDRADAGELRDGVEGPRHALLDLGGPGRLVLGGAPHDGVGVAALAVEARAQEGVGPAGLGAGDLVVVGEGRSGGGRGRGGPAEGCLLYTDRSGRLRVGAACTTVRLLPTDVLPGDSDLYREAARRKER